MKIVLHNDDSLKENDINEWIYRSRGVIINSNNEILLGYCKGTYQFPGGYLEDGENIHDCLKREILEETGIDISTYADEPFYRIKYYSKDWPSVGINRYTEFNYFLILTDSKPNYSKIDLDEIEKELNYEIKYVRLDDLKKILDDSLNENPKNKKVYPEILDVIDVYLKNYRN